MIDKLKQKLINHNFKRVTKVVKKNATDIIDKVNKKKTINSKK